MRLSLKSEKLHQKSRSRSERQASTERLYPHWNAIATHLSKAKASTVVADTTGEDECIEDCIRPSYSLKEKLGGLAWTIIILGSLLIFASLAFLIFLWSANASQSTWHRIVLNGWMTRAVSLTSLVLRNSMALQAGALTSMLAALALERAQVLLDHLASVSTMRNTASGPYWLCWLLFNACRKAPRVTPKLSIFCLALILGIITIVGQFISTLLLSDLQPPATLSGLPATVKLHTGFQYRAPNGSFQDYAASSASTAWTEKALFYPTFAEYAIPSAAQLPDGVVDTGSVLRAFLPFPDAEDRSLIDSYSGQSTVFDSRVVCQRPRLDRTQLFRNGQMLGLTSVIHPNWTNSDLVDPGPRPEDADNMASDSPYSYSNVSLCHAALPALVPADQWPLSVCQVGFAGGLFSAFRPDRTINTSMANARSESYQQWWKSDASDDSPRSNGAPGAQYLMLNLSSGSSSQWFDMINQGGASSSTNLTDGAGAVPMALMPRGEWLDLVFARDQSLKLSVSLCHAAFDSADLKMDASSSKERKEPTRTWQPDSKLYNYDPVLAQLGQAKGGAFTTGLHAQRGILTLRERASWIPNNVTDAPRQSNTYSFLLNAARLEGPQKNTLAMAPAANYTVLLSDAAPPAVDDARSWSPLVAQTNYIGLARQAFENGADAAHTLQVLLTVMAGTTYYDQLERFDRTDAVQQLFLVPAQLFPQHWRGFSAVIAVVAAHMILVLFVTVVFVRGTELSALGNAWQSVAQVMDPRTASLFARVQGATDSQVRRMIRAEQEQVRDLDAGFVTLGPGAHPRRTVLLDTTRRRKAKPHKRRGGSEQGDSVETV